MFRHSSRKLPLNDLINELLPDVLGREWFDFSVLEFVQVGNANELDDAKLQYTLKKLNRMIEHVIDIYQ